MNMDQMEIIVKALAIIIGMVFTMIIKPAIETYVGKDVFNQYVEYIKVAIRCAEQIYTPDQWSKKKEYVYNYAKEKANEIGLELTEQDIDILVEGFVNEIKKG